MERLHPVPETMRLVSLSVALVLSAPALALAQQSPENGPPDRRAAPAAVTSPPTIDGRLDDAAWETAEPLRGFVQREPVEGDPVSERTEVRVLHDGEALYVAAWLYDRDPSGIVLGETRRDAQLRNNDAFQIILDTYLDRQNGFVFGTTPAGIEYDGQVSNEGQGGGGGGGQQRQQAGSGGGFNLNWDGSWEVATSTDGQGWYAEFRIPFSTLRYQAGGAQTWGVNFSRSIRRRSEEAFWAPIPRQFNLHRVSLAGTLTDFQAPTRRVFTVTPYVLGDGFKDYTIPSPEAEVSAEFGVDAKIGLNQSLTLDLTANTDFAQAEVDDQQVNLTRFPLFFPEKRGFFLENAGSFAVGTSRSTELFFSRRVGLARGNAVPILGGGRVTGKIAGAQIGLLNIQTDRLDLIDPVGDTAFGVPVPDTVEISPANNFGVVRIFQEFENRTRLGGIFVSRVNTDDPDDNNLSFALDGALGIGDALTFSGYAASTRTPDVDSAQYAFNGDMRYVTRDWEASAGYRQVGAAFNPEAGFVNRRAYRHFNTRILYHVRTPGTSWFREFRPHVSWNEFWDLSGFSETRTVHIDNHFAFENGAFFQFPGFNITGEGLREPFEIRPGIVVPTGSYNHAEWAFRFNTNQSAPLSLSGGWTVGGFLSGSQFAPNGTLAYRFEDRFVTSLRLSYFDVNLEQGDFETAVYALRGVYSFTPRIYLQGTLQYSDDTENFGANVQLGWLDTGGTGLYLVYNDTEHLGSVPTTGFKRGPQQRQLIVKYTRLLDLGR